MKDRSLPRKVLHALWLLVRENLRMLVALAVIAAAGLVLVVTVLWPAYQSPRSKMYDSSLGYSALMRKLGRPFPVVTAEVREREFVKPLLAEGLCSSEPYLVPVVPMSRILAVHVREGDRVEKGDLLLELDRAKAEIKLESARLALSTAEAELQRVKVGSAYVLAQERPEMEKINLEAATQRAAQASEKLERYREAAKQGLIARTALLEVEREFTDASQGKSLAELHLGMSEKGVEQSRLIAENAVNDAREAVKHREEEIREHQVFAPVSGIVERVLMRAGEFNQDSGKPGFVIAAGLWFEGYFDQADYAWMREGQKGMAYLESHPGKPLEVAVERIVPVVSFSQAGPELNRPLRPRGTGAPEWAATFPVRLGFSTELAGLPMAAGMTGFARMEAKRRSLAVPRQALLSISAGKAVVQVVDSTGRRMLRPVTVGHVDGLAAEILDGLQAGERVISEGHWGLKEEDEIVVTSTEGWN